MKITENNGFWPDEIPFQMLPKVGPHAAYGTAITKKVPFPGGYYPLVVVEKSDFQIWKIRSSGTRRTEYVAVQVTGSRQKNAQAKDVATPVLRCIPGTSWSACIKEMTEMMKERRRSSSPNCNCLVTLRCPECGSFGDFDISVKLFARVSDEGVEDYGDHTDWDERSACACRECDYTSTVEEFEEWWRDGKFPRNPRE